MNLRYVYIGSVVVLSYVLFLSWNAEKEIKQEFLDAGVGRIQSNLTSMVRKGRMTEDKARQLMSLVKPTLTDQDFRQCDMVIEAVIENLPLKQKIFCELERICKPDCILSTNTSTIDITKIAAKMKNPERIVGAHFFSPAHVMQLFEIIRRIGARGLESARREVSVGTGVCVVLRLQATRNSVANRDDIIRITTRQRHITRRAGVYRKVTIIEL